MSSLEDNFDFIFNNAKQAIGHCLISLEDKQINSTTVMSALMWTVIALAKEADNKALINPLLAVDFDIVARFAALMISSNWKLDEEMALKFKEIAFYNLNKQTTILN